MNIQYPKFFFEDIFIDGPLLKADPLRKIRHKKRILQAYDFYVTLRNQSINIDYNEFLSEFFNKFISIVTLLKGEHSVLTSQSKMPDSFFFTHDIWSRYMGWGKDFIECKNLQKKKEVRMF